MASSRNGQAAPLILASASPRRAALLRAAGLRFRVEASGADESSAETDPRRLVMELAARKARAVAARRPGARVLGADTIVTCAGEILGKPRDRADAERILRLLSGRWQTVHTGVALAWEGGRRVLKGAAASRVKARRLPEAALRRLIGKHMDKAGAYAVQDRADPLVERIVGDRDNVTGLPMRVVRRLLARSRRPARARAPRAT
ncbi:MAG: septum formation protein Maf [Elusimicrobia bacterium]|nr:septum formation protein Maf [Elusimicrobiota bacterium]